MLFEVFKAKNGNKAQHRVYFVDNRHITNKKAFTEFYLSHLIDAYGLRGLVTIGCVEAMSVAEGIGCCTNVT